MTLLALIRGADETLSCCCQSEENQRGNINGRTGATYNIVLSLLVILTVITSESQWSIQGGRSWQAFGGRKNAPSPPLELFRKFIQFNSANRTLRQNYVINLPRSALTLIDALIYTVWSMTTGHDANMCYH